MKPSYFSFHLHLTADNQAWEKNKNASIEVKLKTKPDDINVAHKVVVSAQYNK